MSDLHECFFCKDNFPYKKLKYLNLDRIDVSISKCDSCNNDLYLNVLSLEKQNKKFRLKFYTKKGNEVIKYERYTELIKNYFNEQISIDSVGYQFEFEGENDSKTQILFFTDIYKLKTHLFSNFDHKNSQKIILNENYYKHYIFKHFMIYFERTRKTKRQMQNYMLEVVLWSPENNYLFPNKLRKKIFSFYVCMKIIGDFTNYWNTPIKIPKFVMIHIIQFL